MNDAKIYVSLADLNEVLNSDLKRASGTRFMAVERLNIIVAKREAKEAAQRKKAEVPRRQMTYMFTSMDSMKVMQAMAEATGLGVPNVRFSIKRTVTAEDDFFIKELPAIAKKFGVKLILETR